MKANTLRRVYWCAWVGDEIKWWVDEHICNGEVG